MSVGRQLETFEITACARAAHETVRAYCEAMGDFSHQSWDVTPNDLQTIARASVIGIATHEHTPEQSHENWIANKRAQGWSYGDRKDAVAKTHPCLVEWKDLPLEQQVKDRLWVTIVKALCDSFWKIPRQ